MTKKFKARYPGKCQCGCGESFEPGILITGYQGNYQIVHKSDTDLDLIHQINRTFTGNGMYDWNELEEWALRTKDKYLADLCSSLQTV